MKEQKIDIAKLVEEERMEKLEKERETSADGEEQNEEEMLRCLITSISCCIIGLLM